MQIVHRIIIDGIQHVSRPVPQSLQHLHLP